MKHLTRYIGGEFLISFIVSFAFFFFIFFINQLLLLAEDILQKDVPLFEVALLIFYSLPAIIALSVPFGTLVGTLMAAGRLSGDSEIVAFRASGFSLRQIFTPILVIAILLSGFSFVVNDILLPQGTLNFGRVYRDLLYANPALELEPYSVMRYQDNTLVTGSVEPGRLDQFVIIDRDVQGNRRVIASTRAQLLRDADPNAIGLQLSDVVSHTVESNREYHFSIAERMTYNILLQDITVAIRSPGPREMSARDVWEEIEVKRSNFVPRLQRHDLQLAALQARMGLAAKDTSRRSAARLQQALEEYVRLRNQRPFDRSLQIYLLEYHKKFSIPFASISFVFLAFPLGLFSKRSGRGVGFGIGLLMATMYWAMLIGGQTFGSQRQDVSPILAMWLPNIMFFVIGVVVFVRRARH